MKVASVFTNRPAVLSGRISEYSSLSRGHHSPSISSKVLRESGQIHADKCPGPGGLAGPDIACCCSGFPWTAHTRDPSRRFCMTQSGAFTIFDIAQILTSSVHHTDERKLLADPEPVVYSTASRKSLAAI
jgi:hypothetical protein